MWGVKDMYMMGRASFCAVVLLIVAFLGVTVAEAYIVEVHDPEMPYAIMSMNATQNSQRWYVGELTGFPEMYSFSVLGSSTVALSLRIPYTENIVMMRPTLLVVRVAQEQGVEEVLRLQFDESQWSEQTDVRSGLRFYAPEVLNLELPTGDYRIEISSATDTGKYMLVGGNEVEKVPYPTALRTVHALYDFYDVPVVLMVVRSPLLYQPIGIMVLVSLIGLTWRYRTRLRLS